MWKMRRITGNFGETGIKPATDPRDGRRPSVDTVYARGRGVDSSVPLPIAATKDLATSTRTSRSTTACRETKWIGFEDEHQGGGDRRVLLYASKVRLTSAASLRSRESRGEQP